MKRVNYLLVGLLSLSLLVSCSKDDDHLSGGGSENSGDIYAAFTIRTGGPGTYATEGGDPVEGTIANVHIYIFDKGVLDAEDAITMSGTGTGAVGTTTIETSLGKKRVYALVNSTGNITLPAVETGVTTIAEFENLLKQKDILNDDKIAKSGEFLMFGVAEETLTETDHGSSDKAKLKPITINVNRVSSKVSLVYDENTATKPSLEGAITGVEFALNQTHKQVSIARELRTGIVTEATGDDFNYTLTIPTTHTAAGGTYNHLALLADQTADVNYKSSIAATSATIPMANSHYCLENINATPYTGNVTFALVRLKFAPEPGKTTDATKGDFSEHATTTTLTGDDFWTVTLNGEQHIFANSAEASTAMGAALAGGVDQKHTGGLCYYRLDLRYRMYPITEMTKRYAVLRNAIYKINITSINGVGDGEPGNLIPTDPDTELEENAFITAKIDVIDWTVFDMDEELGN